ncbi:MAG: NAD(P)/FAD-dependent oxidoreductase, partial [Candidatus Nitrosomaritimum yanchengensis]
DSAIEEATFLTKFATKVHVVHRRNELRASKVMQERAFNNEKIQFHWDSAVTDIKGDQKMQQAIIKNLKTDEEKTLDVGGLFVAIGHEPNTKLFKNQIELDDEGYIVLKNKTKTNIEGVFAAGDVHDRIYRQAITAAGFGCMAAIDVDKYLTEKS